MSDARIVITGHAYGRRATIELLGDTLMWRAHRGGPPIAENIATTIHDVRKARWLPLAWSRGGAALLGLGALWALSDGLALGASLAALGLAMLIRRRLRPRQFLVLELGDRQLVMQVTGLSTSPARALADRIQRTLASGEAPRATPILP